MTYNELMAKVLEIFPEAIIDEDAATGEVTIATGLMAPSAADNFDEELFELR